MRNHATQGFTMIMLRIQPHSLASVIASLEITQFLILYLEKPDCVNCKAIYPQFEKIALIASKHKPTNIVFAVTDVGSILTQTETFPWLKELTKFPSIIIFEANPSGPALYRLFCDDGALIKKFVEFYRTEIPKTIEPKTEESRKRIKPPEEDLKVKHQKQEEVFETSIAQIYDVIIIGSGPAAYSCALYTARANRNFIVFEGNTEQGFIPGGQLTSTGVVENYLGAEDANGYDLTQKFKQQAKKFGGLFVEKTVSKVSKTGDMFFVVDGDKEYQTRTVVIATGATAKKLSLPEEERYWHHGISACAVCDGALPMFRNQPIAVVGGGDSAMEEALTLSKFGKVVYVIHRGPKLRASKIMQDRAKANSKIKFLMNSQVLRLHGGKKLESIEIQTDDKQQTLGVSGLFYAIGHTPNTSFLNNLLELDSSSYIKTQGKSTKTSLEGVFACGDVQDPVYRQAITAAGSGCMAALDVEHFLQEKIKL